jgi:protoheme IX farnesyltransferase
MSTPPLGGRAGGGAAALAPVYGPTPFVLLWPDLSRARQTVADYVALTKPGIMTLLLLTTLGAMLVAAEGFPSFGLILATLLGGTLAAGGANALNCYLDRDIDAQMARTRKRGTANGRISPTAALAFGVALSALAIVELAVWVNWLAALLALAGNLFYVFVYTKWLKRTTPQNIVIGGAAGAVPPLVGWAAVTGDLSWAPWLMFLTIFMWTPPHFWALALLKQGEYGRAAVPMLPVVAGEAVTRRQILAYTVLLIPVTLALGLVGLGWLYLAAALVLNGVFLWLAVRLWRTPSKRLARRTFFWSLWYLAFLFVAMVADRLLL